MFNRWQGVVFALLAALLFGASTPLAKSLLPQLTPMLMAGLLYLGSGIGLSIYTLLRSRWNVLRPQEAALTRKDWPWLAGAIAAGGVVAPVLLMQGLAMTPASSASLLLNLEGVLTAVLAWFVFKENFDRRIAAAAYFLLERQCHAAHHRVEEIGQVATNFGPAGQQGIVFVGARRGGVVVAGA
jgi:drug/metabolite transporter (DMT)-like permease